MFIYLHLQNNHSLVSGLMGSKLRFEIEIN